MRKLLSITAGLAVVLCTQQVHAVPLKFDFTGVVDTSVVTPTGIWVGQGTTVTGSFTYDSDLSDDIKAGNSTWDLFGAKTPNQNLQFDISVNLGSISRSTSNNQNFLGQNHHSVQWMDMNSFDIFRMVGQKFAASDDHARIEFRDNAPPTPDGVAVGTGNLTDTPITDLINLSLFDSQSNEYDSYNDAGESEGIFRWKITSLSAESTSEDIPEPTTVALLCVGLAGLGFRNRKKKLT